MKLKNRKADESVLETVIFIILNLTFFSLMLFFIVRAGNSDTAVEEMNAKKIALILDDMRPNMGLNVSLADVYDLMNKNKFYNAPVYVNGNSVNVKVKEGVGSNFDFFSDVNPQLLFDDANKILIIKT